MKFAILTRRKSTQDGTFGDWMTPTFSCKTLERLLTGEHPCIPVGTFLCRLRYSPAHKALDFGFGPGVLYGVEMVPGRDNIEIHNANFIWQLLGCIAPGEKVMLIENPADMKMYMGVSNSKATLKALMNDLNGESFMLTVKEEYEPAA